MKNSSEFSKYSLDFDCLLNIQLDLKSILFLAKKSRTKCKTFSINAKELVKQAKHAIDCLVNYQITNEKLAKRVKQAIKKLNLLSSSLVDIKDHPEDYWLRYEEETYKLHGFLKSVLEKLGNILPINFGVQLELFESKKYENSKIYESYLPGVRDWLCRYPCIKKVRTVCESGAIKQLSIPLWNPPCPESIKSLTLRKARKMASVLGLPQKVNGRDLSRDDFIASFEKLWKKGGGIIRTRFTEVLATPY